MKVIKAQDLVGLTNKTGDVMMKGLRQLEQKYPATLHAARGLGTFCAIDCPTAEIRYNVRNVSMCEIVI